MNILLKKFPYSMFSSDGQLTEVGKVELKSLPLICCFSNFYNKNARKKTMDDRVKESIRVGVLPHNCFEKLDLLVH